MSILHQRNLQWQFQPKASPLNLFGTFSKKEGRLQQRDLVISRVLFGAAAIALFAQPVVALTQVTGITLNPTASGIDIVLQLQAQSNTGDRPQVFTSGQGNTWTATITNAQLSLPTAKLPLSSGESGSRHCRD